MTRMLVWPPLVDSQRAGRHPPPERLLWAQFLFVALKAMGKTPRWLGERVGYHMPQSMHQVVNGHQGISQEVYEAILVHVPAMRYVPPPPIKVVKKAKGARGIHKPHDYPDGVERRPHRW